MEKKRVLLIAPVFFNYYKAMLQGLEQLGYEAVYVCDAPSNSNLSKAIGRVNKKLIRRAAEHYFDGEVRAKITGQRFDAVLVVGGMTFAFTGEMMKQLRQMQPQSRFVLYQWDSERNLPYSTGIHPYFDAIYTFDRQDALRDSRYRLLPLFYTDAYRKIAEMEQKDLYDCMYVGTAHPFKYRDINAICASLSVSPERQFIRHYMPSQLKFWYQKVTSEAFRHAKQSEMCWQKVSEQELMEVMASSRCVLDAPQEGQTGLTIRTIECLGAKRKLITTNPEVAHYDFYDPNNIWVYEEGKVPDAEFFATPYRELPEEIYQKYSLRSWLLTLLRED